MNSDKDRRPGAGPGPNIHGSTWALGVDGPWPSERLKRHQSPGPAGGSSDGAGAARPPSWAPGWPGARRCAAVPPSPARLSLTLLPSPPPLPRPRCCPSAPTALPDPDRPLMAPLLVLLGRRVAARTLVLVAVSSERDHLGDKGTAQPPPATPLCPLSPRCWMGVLGRALTLALPGSALTEEWALVQPAPS